MTADVAAMTLGLEGAVLEEVHLGVKDAVGDSAVVTHAPKGVHSLH